jgi:beta-glucosidase
MKFSSNMNQEERMEFVDNILTDLSLKEKIHLMSGHGFIKYLLLDMGFGKRAYPAGGVKRVGIPVFKFTDGPRGVIIPGSTCFPVSMARAASWDLDLEEKIGDAIGKEVRAHGGNLFGGICINLLRHPAGGRAQETYGEDQYLLGEFGAALVRGVQKHNVMTTVKHFAANNMENARFKINVEMTERTLREVYLPHFKRCIDEGCATVMSAYNKLRGEHCGHNPYLLRTILKQDWDFKGFVHSDWMFGLKDTLKGIKGGLDVEMPIARFYGRKLIKAVKSGEVPIELIDDAASRIIRTTLKYTSKGDDDKYPKELICCESHIKLAQKAAEESMVLLKNENSFLPFDLDNMKKIVIIGKLADLKNTGDHGSSNVKQDNIVTPLKGVLDFCANKVEIEYAEGKDEETLKQVVSSSDAAVIIVGYTHEDEGEYIKMFGKVIGGDRDDLGLHSEDVKLINTVAETNHNIAVVLVGGSAITMEDWKSKAKAILVSWYSGMEGGNALANILFGKVNPSGKLPFTIPKDPNQLPFFDKNANEIEYGYYHGYTLFEKQNLEPAFSFGFGLSYTDFEYRNLNVEKNVKQIVVKVTVKNVGPVEGDEIVQVYIGFENSKIDRPLKLLKGFTRITLNPNEEKEVTIKIDKDKLKWYNPETKEWEFENMEYSVHVGGSSKNEDLLTQNITL